MFCASSTACAAVRFAPLASPDVRPLFPLTRLAIFPGNGMQVAMSCFLSTALVVRHTTMFGLVRSLEGECGTAPPINSASPEIEA
jgi:hypothetical protein